MHRRQTLLGLRPRLLRIFADARGHHQQQALAGTVEGYDAVVEPEPCFRKPALIATARGDCLDQTHRVVAEVAHRPAGKGRQAFDGCHRTEICCPPQFLDRRTVSQRPVHEYRPVTHLDDSERIGTNERVSSCPFAALDAFEQEGIAAIGRKAGVDRERGHRIRGELLHHRHDVIVLAELQELLFVRPNLHGSPSVMKPTL